MKWRRNVDYHGSRTYGREARPNRFIQRAKAMLKSVLRPTRESRGFSLLGSKTDHDSLRREHAVNCPFPVMETAIVDARAPRRQRPAD